MFRNIIVLLSLLLASLQMSAQVIVSLKMDTNQIYIGEQVLLKLKVTADANQVVIMPEYPDSQLVKGVEVLNHYTESTEILNAGKRHAVTEAYHITSFDSALYYIPPIEVEVDGKKYVSRQGMALKVVSPNVDTTKVDKFYGPMENAEVLYDWSDLKRPVIFWFIGVLLIFASIYIALQIKNNHRILPKIRLRPEGPPHKWAMKQIDKLKSNTPATPEEAHVYYTDLTDIIRTYIAKRYGFKATAMTSAQIIEQLKGANDPRLLEELSEMFQAADLVKYAGMSAVINENDRNMLIAVEYVNATKDIESENKKNRKPKVEPEVKRSHQVRTMLVVINIILAAAGIGLVAWAATIMYNLYF